MFNLRISLIWSYIISCGELGWLHVNFFRNNNRVAFGFVLNGESLFEFNFQINGKLWIDCFFTNHFFVLAFVQIWSLNLPCVSFQNKTVCIIIFFIFTIYIYVIFGILWFPWHNLLKRRLKRRLVPSDDIVVVRSRHTRS